MWLHLISIYVTCLHKLPYTLFFLSNTFMSNTRLKLPTNKAKVKRHPETELFLPSKSNMAYSERLAKKQVCQF